MRWWPFRRQADPPELVAVTKNMDEFKALLDGELQRLDGKPVSKRDALKWLELSVTDEQGNNGIYLRLAQHVMYCALNNEKRGLETRGRPKRGRGGK
jgi:hypothetical protein